MKRHKFIVAGLFVLGGLSSFAINARDAGLSEVSRDMKVTQEKGEGASFCQMFPWLCVTTSNNGGGHEPGKPKNGGD